MFIIICFVNEYFVQNSSNNQVKLGKNVRKWRDFYNPYCKYFGKHDEVFLEKRRWNKPGRILIPSAKFRKVYYYPCSTERNSELFSLPWNGSERNYASFASILFHGTEFRALFSSAEWVRNEIPRFLRSAEQAEFHRNKQIFPPIPSSAE